MKKILMLVLVLAVAGIASAASVFTTTSPSPYLIDITLVDSGVQAFDVYIDYTPLLAFGITPEQATLTGSAPIVALNLQHLDPDGFNLYALSFGSTTTLTPGLQGTLDINGAAANEGTTLVALNVFNGAGEAAGQVSVLVNNIPEPITMSLLAVGGLFLRRRK